MFKRNIIVFDFETDGVDPQTCNPVQLAAVALNAFTFKKIPGSEFNVFIRPEGIDDQDYFKSHSSTISWHAKIKGDKTPEEIYESWKDYKTTEKQAWMLFKDYCDRYNPYGKAFNSPIPAGANIINFDLKIYERLNAKYKIKTNFFWLRDAIDIQTIFYLWLENREDCPSNFKMDTMREYFGVSSDNAHDALNDVEVCALFISRFMNLHRDLSKKISFSKSFEKTSKNEW